MTSSAPRPARSGPRCSSSRAQILGCRLFCDRGLRGRELERSLELVEVEPITRERHRLGERPPAELEKTRIRLVIESVFASLKRQMRLEQHLAKTLAGLVQRVAQRLLTLTLGTFCNLLAGPPGQSTRRPRRTLNRIKHLEGPPLTIALLINAAQCPFGGSGSFSTPSSVTATA
jgi:Transposase DDE domain